MGYSTIGYNVDIDVRKDYTYVVVEKITADFKDPKHGMVREISFGKKCDLIRKVIVEQYTDNKMARTRYTAKL